MGEKKSVKRNVGIIITKFHTLWLWVFREFGCCLGTFFSSSRHVLVHRKSECWRRTDKCHVQNVRHIYLFRFCHNVYILSAITYIQQEHLYVSTVSVPAITIPSSNSIQRFEKASINISIGHICHCHAYKLSIPTQIVLHVRKCKLNRVEVGRVGREIFATHSSVIRCSDRYNLWWTVLNKNKPCLDHFPNVRVFVYPTVIHDDNWVWRWVWLHILKKVLDEFRESVGAERAFNNLALNHPIIEWDSWKDRKTVKPSALHTGNLARLTVFHEQKMPSVVLECLG